MYTRCDSCPTNEGLVAFQPHSSLQEILRYPKSALRRSLCPERVLRALRSVPSDRVIFTTLNSHALVSGRGDTLQTDKFHLEGHPAAQAITLERPSGDVIGATIFETACPELRGLDALHFYSLSGELIHRVIFSPGNHSAVFANMDEIAIQPPKDDIQANDKVFSLTEIKSLKMNWDQLGALGHLEHLKRYQGRSRHKILPHMGRDRAIRMRAEGLFPWLNYLHKNGLVYSRIIPQFGWLQSDSSEVQSVSLSRGYIAVESAAGATLIDQSNISCCWETRFLDGGLSVSLIEIYSRCGKCVMVLAPFRNFLLNHWLEVTSKLSQR